MQQARARPFFTTKPAGQGAGLGLAMVYGLVKQLNGHISFQSRPQDGTRFDVYLPRAAQLVQPNAASSEPLLLPAVRLTVLLVDDNEPVRLVTERMLRQLGHHVVTAEYGAEALEKALAHRGVSTCWSPTSSCPG